MSRIREVLSMSVISELYSEQDFAHFKYVFSEIDMTVPFYMVNITGTEFGLQGAANEMGAWLNNQKPNFSATAYDPVNGRYFIKDYRDALQFYMLFGGKFQ